MSIWKKSRIGLLLLSIGIIILALLYNKFCIYNENFACLLKVWSSVFFDSLAWISLITFPSIIFTFFISDKIFKKWLIFTAIYFAITAFLIHLSPEYASGSLGLGPTKELVAMNMSWIFVVISLIMFIWMSHKEKRK